MISKMDRMVELLEIAVDMGITEDDLLSLIYKKCENTYKSGNITNLSVAFCASRLRVLGNKTSNAKLVHAGRSIVELNN